MKIFYNLIKLSFSFLLFITIAFVGCKDKPTPTLFDNVPTTPIGATPVINSITPDSALAGVTEITINGSNFSSNPTDNFVYFNGRLGKVITASANQLVVKSPGLPDESMAYENTELKIAVFGAELFSDSRNYKLLAAVSRLYAFAPSDVPKTLTSDNEGNIYTSITVSGAGGGISKITPNGDYSLYAPRGIETFWNGLRFSPDDTLYSAKLLAGVWQILEGAVPENKPWVIISGSKIGDIDFDSDKNIWAVGKNKSIYKISPDKVTTSFPFDATLRTVKIFNNAVYAGGEQNSVEAVWKFDIAGDGTIGAGEQYFNFSDNFNGKIINAITFSEDGDLYIASDAAEQIIVVHPNKDFEPLYPGLLKPSEALSFAWDNSTNLYYTRAAGEDSSMNDISPTIIRLNVQKKGVR